MAFTASRCPTSARHGAHVPFLRDPRFLYESMRWRQSRFCFIYPYFSSLLASWISSPQSFFSETSTFDRDCHLTLPTNKTVAWAFLGYMMLFAVAYIVIAISSRISLWRLWVLLIRAASILMQFVLRFFYPPWRGAVCGALFSATNVTSTIWRARIAGQITAPQC